MTVDADRALQSSPPPPDFGATWRTIALVGLFVLASFAALYVARPVALPVVVGLLLSFVLTPPVRGLCRLGLARPVASGLVLLGLVAFLAAAAYFLTAPAIDWIDRAPQTFDRLEERVRQVKEPVEKVTRATHQVEKLTEVDGEAADRQVTVAKPTFTEGLMAATGTLVATLLVVLVLLYFLLAAGDLFLLKTVRILPRLEDKKRAVEITRSIERDVSAYLLTVTVINGGLGVAVGLAVWLFGLPNPALWGALAALLNFVPYLGAMVGVAIVALVAFSSLDGTWAPLLPPLAYLVLTAIEGSFLTPILLGRRLTLNPLAIFLSVLFWGWIWGVPGALIAVPLLAVVKIVADRVPRLGPLGELLGR